MDNKIHMADRPIIFSVTLLNDLMENSIRCTPGRFGTIPITILQNSQDQRTSIILHKYNAINLRLIALHCNFLRYFDQPKHFNLYNCFRFPLNRIRLHIISTMCLSIEITTLNKTTQFPFNFHVSSCIFMSFLQNINM